MAPGDRAEHGNQAQREQEPVQPPSQANVAAGRLMVNARKQRSRINGSTRNSPIAKIAHKPTIACIHQALSD
jgi:hypothetical protein